MSKYEVFSGLYFPASGLETGIYRVILRIQFEYGKIWTRKSPYLDTFHTVSNSSIYLLVITIQFRFACGDILLNREKVQKYFDHDCGFYYHSFIPPSLVRNCVSFKIVSRENDAITPDIIVAQNESMLLVLLINYSLSNIYNADKFVFFSFYRTTFIS